MLILKKEPFMNSHKKNILLRHLAVCLLSLHIIPIIHADDASNILLPTVAGAAIGGAAGGSRGAGIGALVGLGTGAMINASSNSSKKNHRRRSRDYDDRINALEEENKDLIQENRSLARENKRLEKENEKLKEENERLNSMSYKKNKKTTISKKDARKNQTDLEPVDEADEE